MLTSGMILKNRYEILDDIGSGGMARVYKVMDRVLNRPAALKVLKEELMSDEAYLRRFYREAQAAAGLVHDNIVNVYDVDEDQGYVFIVMELVEGLTLKQYIRRRGRLGWKECLSISLQAADALSAAHKAGIIHRDIKPENLILSMEGNVKISDFGIARVQSGDTMTVDVCGSVYYSSPEQIRGGYSDVRTDIYSLGVTMYEMCTGKLPFTGNSVVEVAMQHLEGSLIPPKQQAPDIPEAYNRIILKCMSRRMDDRYQTMDALLKDLMFCVQNPERVFQESDGPVDGSTMVFSRDTIGSINENRSAMASTRDMAKVRKKRGASSPETKKTAGTSSQEKKSRRQKKAEEKRRQTLEQAEEYEAYDDSSGGISSGLTRALNIGIVIIVLLILLCIVHLILSSLGIFQGMSDELPFSLDSVGTFLRQLWAKLSSQEMRQGARESLRKLLTLLPGNR